MEESRMVMLPRSLQDPCSLVFRALPIIKIIPIVGMAGIGKTTLAKQIFQHPRMSFFECRAWVTVGRDGELQQITRDILRQIDPCPDHEGFSFNSLRSRVTEILAERRYLIVLDDIWDVQLWEELKNLLYDYNKRQYSGILLTTRLQNLAASAAGSNNKVVQMPFFDDQESWDLLSQEVFGNMPCPLELEKDGKKIAQKCDGLPLTIVTVAAILSSSSADWKEIAEKKNHPVFSEAYDRIYGVLYPSYDQLPIDLRICFLYMGVFPTKYEIPTSKLIRLWSAEKFLDTDSRAVESLNELHSRSVAMKLHESSNGGIKICRLHSALWYFCKRKASEERFFVVLDSYADCLGEDVGEHLRLAINNNVLFGIKDLRGTIDPTWPVCSLLCFGPYHDYHVPIWTHLTSVEVVDSLSIRFYEFPMDILMLVRLRYLALTCNADIPSTISQLKYLQFLIVRQHMSIRSSRSPSDLPKEIWEMKELKHLQVTGSNLPDPNSTDACLPNLVTLSEVDVRSCTEELLKRIPNLEKLGIKIELQPDGAAEPMWFQISHLKKLKSLTCVVVNPVLSIAVKPCLPQLSSDLNKLSLSGLGYPWEEMSKIGSLLNLRVLKLGCYAFQGPKWEVGEWEFPRLNYILIEDTDLVDWRAASSSFGVIKRIILKNCYRLPNIPDKFWNSVSVELVDCNPQAAQFQNHIYMPVHHRNVHATYSWQKSKA